MMRLFQHTKTSIMSTADYVEVSNFVSELKNNTKKIASDAREIIISEENGKKVSLNYELAAVLGDFDGKRSIFLTPHFTTIT